MTMGVRLIVPGSENRVLLVRHSYVKGWHLPGGGVEKNETAEMTAHKELLEETGLVITGKVKLLGIYANRKASKRDHVLLYMCQDWRKEREFIPNNEIVEIGFFSRNKLPEGTTSATRNRLAEVYSGQEPTEVW